MHISEELKNGIKLMLNLQELDSPAFELKAYIEELPYPALKWVYVITPVGLPQMAKLIIDPFDSLTVELYSETIIMTDRLTVHDNADLHKTAEMIVSYLKNPSAFDRFKNADRA
jgi:hypothetical protein